MFRATQFCDKDRLASHSANMIATASFGTTSLYTPFGAVWGASPSPALYQGNPVVQVTEPARAATTQALAGKQAEFAEPAYR